LDLTVDGELDELELDDFGLTVDGELDELELDGGGGD